MLQKLGFKPLILIIAPKIMGLMHQYGSLGVPQTPKSNDALIEVFKFIRKKMNFCTYIEAEMLKIYFEVCEPFDRS